MRSTVVALFVAGLISGCIVHTINGSSHVTGTCSGACDHYVECKPGHSDVDASRCRTECPDVFADRDSLAAYENLSCDDAVTFVDGTPRATSKR